MNHHVALNSVLGNATGRLSLVMQESESLRGLENGGHLHLHYQLYVYMYRK